MIISTNIITKLRTELDEIPVETSTINNVAQSINLFIIAFIRSSINRSLEKQMERNYESS